MLQTKKILVIDDDPQVAKMMETVLATKGYAVYAAHDGAEGWAKIQSVNPDLVLLDIMMPEISGIELCKKIKESPEFSKTVVIMLSAKDSQSDRLTGLKYGADDYITKPFHVSSLVNKIEFLLKK